MCALGSNICVTMKSFPASPSADTGLNLVSSRML
jgi:hypothetical protein